VDKNTVELMGSGKVRPIRVAFFVEAGRDAELMLDAIFADCHSRWGGRFSLIVPCEAGQIVADYWPWLEAFDPDIVYAYVKLDDDAVLEIHERVAPADYIFHWLEHGSRLDLARLRPKYHVEALSSLSTIFRVARHRAPATGPAIKILDSSYPENSTRFLSDNFGTYTSSFPGRSYRNDAWPRAGLLTVVPQGEFESSKHSVPDDGIQIAMEQEALAELVSGRATGLGLLSSLYAPSLHIQDNRWSGAFNLIVGETFEDRLLFWNSRLLLSARSDDDSCCLRVTRDQLEEKSVVTLLIQLMDIRNRYNAGYLRQPRLKVWSASHNKEELTDLVNMLSGANVNCENCAVESVSHGHVIPDENSLRDALIRAQAGTARLDSGEHYDFRWTPPNARLPERKPGHLQDAPLNLSFGAGLWAHDLRFEFERDGGRAPKTNTWMLPKRWRMAGAFRPTFVTRVFSGNRTPLRTSKQGDLTVFAGVDHSLESVLIPNMDEAFWHALCANHRISRIGPDQPPWPAQIAKWIRPSNEAPHLIGVLGITGGLALARSLLLHPFWQKVFANLGGTPNLAEADLRMTVDSLTKRNRGSAVFDLNEESERFALARLIVNAAQSIKSPKMHVALESLCCEWKDYIDERSKQMPEEMRPFEELRKHLGLFKQPSIEDYLSEMRTRRMVFQGYPWTCKACQHRNWTDFQALQPSLRCEVCSFRWTLPVGIPWYFRANEFLIESLRSHSVLSLLWVLSALSCRAKHSFMYLGPTCFGYSKESRSEAEADLLAVVDGESVLCEVKSAWRSLRTKHINTFVDFAKRLRPDRAILAVMEEGKRFEEDIRNAEKALAGEGIRFEVLTLETYRVHDNSVLLP
jgi:hypothetical protein